MARSSKPIELPGCAPLPLRYKDVPLTNGDGAALGKCPTCAGTGTICSAQKVEQGGPASPPQTVYKDFTGAEAKKYQKKGWSVTSRACPFCKGAGLLVEGDK